MTYSSPRRPVLGHVECSLLAPAFLLLALFAAWSLAHFASAAFLNADAWSVYDMARSFDETFYRGMLIRQFNLPLDRGSSYPFLTPALTYGIDKVWGIGIYGLYMAGAAAGIAALIGLGAIARRFDRLPVAGTVTGGADGQPDGTEGDGRGVSRFLGLSLAGLLVIIIGLNINELYLDLYRASTIPMALLFIVAGIGLASVGHGLTAKRAAAIGFLMGLAGLSRFNANLFIFVFTAAIFLLALPGRRIAATAAYAIGVAVAVSPWAVYSLLNLGRLYAMDHTAIAISTVPHYVTDLILAGEGTLFTDFATWSQRVKGNFHAFTALIAAMAERNLLAQVFTGVTVGGFVLGAVALAFPSRTASPRDTVSWRPAATLVLAALASLTFAIGPVLAGIQENTRYYSLPFLLGAVALLALAYTMVNTAAARGGRYLPRRVLDVAVAATCVFGIANLPRDILTSAPANAHFDPANLTLDAADPSGMFRRCVPTDGRTLLLYRYSNHDLQDAMRFGVMARRQVIVMPGNWPTAPLDAKNAFLRDGKVTHVLLGETGPANDLAEPEHMPLEAAGGECPGLYRVVTPASRP